MPDIKDLDSNKLKKIEDYIGKGKILNYSLKLEDTTLNSMKGNKPFSPFAAHAFSFLSRFKKIDIIISFLRDNSLVNGGINLIDRILSIHKNIQDLWYFNYLSTFGSVSTFCSSVWWILEKIGIMPEQKPFWLKIIDGVISAIGYISGLSFNILDIIYNPNPIRKIQAVIEIVLATIAFFIHIYNLIKD